MAPIHQPAHAFPAGVGASRWLVFVSSPPDRPPKMLARQAKLLFCVKGGQRSIFAIDHFDIS